jgi:two-component system sensor histidine kinase KdpD
VASIRRALVRLEREPGGRLGAALASLALLAAVTGAIYALRPIAPVLSLGVLYLLAVLPVAALWGLPVATLVSLASMVAFNFLFLPPTHTLRLASSENWVALAVYLLTSVGVSGLAQQARRRAEEAERQRLERAQLARDDAAKTAILRSVSHDLRSPITAIATASEVLERRGTLAEAEADELVASIRSEVQRLDRLVSNLLELSRLEAGAARPLPELWTVDALVERALEAIRDDARIVVTVPDDVPAVRVDATQVVHALVNLLENALKFSAAGEPVEVRAQRAADDVLLRVVDHGPGVAAAERERIFQPFDRGANSGRGRGTGLGLAIARGFVQLNGGRLWVDPAEGGGAAFVLALPAFETAKAPA